MQIGIGGWTGSRPGVQVARERGATVDHASTDIDRCGLERIAEMALEIAWKNAKAVLLSFDIDSVDPAFAPGTGTPEAGRLAAARGVAACCAIVAREGLAGMEVVEVSPPYDVADITSLLGVRVIIEVLGTLVLNGKLGKRLDPRQRQRQVNPFRDRPVISACSGTCRDPADQALPRYRERDSALVPDVFITAILAICLLGGSLVVAIYMAARSDQERHADAIVVMGAAQFDGRPSAVLKARLDTTYQVWKDGVAPVIIVTGGKMPGDRFTESEASRDYLVDRGVPEEAILLENEGRTSQSSLQRVATIARDHHIHSVVIVSDGFHLFRSKLIADRNGLDAFGVPAEDSPIPPGRRPSSGTSSGRRAVYWLT